MSATPVLIKQNAALQCVSVQAFFFLFSAKVGFGPFVVACGSDQKAYPAKPNSRLCSCESDFGGENDDR